MSLSCHRWLSGASSSSGPVESRHTHSNLCPLLLHHPPLHRSHRQLHRFQAVQAAVTSTSSNVQELLGWLGQKGVSVDKLAATPVSAPESEHGSLYLRCKRSLNRSEACFSIPDSAWLTPKVVKASAIGSLVQQLDAWLQIAIFLLYNLQQIAESPWGGYLHSLPAEVDTPLSWSGEELAALEGSQLLSTLQGYREFFKGLYQSLEANLFSQHRQHFSAEGFSSSKFLWAVQTVRSRVHAPLDGKNIALVPFADLVQHRRGVNSQWKVQSGLFGGSQSVSLDAASPLAAGEVVAMDYGPDKLDSSLLLDYGVLDADRPQAGFLLSLAIPEQDRFFDDKADILDLNDLAESWQFVLRPGERPTPELLAFLRLINLSGPDSFLLEAMFRNDAWGHLNLPVSEENEAALCQSMIDGCREALQGYATSIDQDLAILRQENLPPRIAKAVQVRLGEKEALDSTLQYFESREKALDKLEFYQERRLKGLGLLDESGSTTYNELEEGIM